MTKQIRSPVEPQRCVSIPVDAPIWDRIFMVAPLVIVGSREGGGGYDLAPKHMAMPLGWDNRYCFVCSPRHATQQNIADTGEFTVSFPTPAQIEQTSMAAGPRMEDGSKPTLGVLHTLPASTVDGVLVSGAYLWLECVLEQVLEGFGDNSLIIGRVVAAAADEQALRSEPQRDDELLQSSPLLAYLSPGRFAGVGETEPFPFRADFSL